MIGAHLFILIRLMTRAISSPFLIIVNDSLCVFIFFFFIVPRMSSSPTYFLYGFVMLTQCMLNG